MRVRVLGALATLSLAATLALAGCGGADGADGVATVGGDTGSAKPSSTATLSQQEKAVKFAQCMRENGVEMPDPDPSGGGFSIGGEDLDMDKMRAAQQACKAFSPFGEGPRQQDPAAAENMRKFAQCMRDNGVPNFPDADGGMVKIDESVGGDPDFPAAQKKCEKKFMPAGPGGTF
jgi:hypothetical protein